MSTQKLLDTMEAGRPRQEELEDHEVDPQEDDHASDPDHADNDEGSGSDSDMHSMNQLITHIQQMEDDNCPPLKGSLYYLLFIGRFELFTLKFVGFMAIIFLQVMGPIATIWWAVRQIKWNESTVALVTFDLGPHGGLSHFLKTHLAVAFLICLTLNGLSVVKVDHEMTIKLRWLFNSSNEDNKKFDFQDDVDWNWLKLGIAINATLPVACSICLFLLFIIAEQPKDVLFDSLGMTFLYTLDDIDGPLGLLSRADWDEDIMGRFYSNSFKQKVPDCSPVTMTQVERKNRQRYGSYIFTTAAWIMRILAFILPLAFCFTDGIKTWPQN